MAGRHPGNLPVDGDNASEHGGAAGFRFEYRKAESLPEAGNRATQWNDTGEAEHERGWG